MITVIDQRMGPLGVIRSEGRVLLSGLPCFCCTRMSLEHSQLRNTSAKFRALIRTVRTNSYSLWAIRPHALHCSSLNIQQTGSLIRVFIRVDTGIKTYGREDLLDQSLNVESSGKTCIFEADAPLSRGDPQMGAAVSVVRMVRSCRGVWVAHPDVHQSPERTPFPPPNTECTGNHYQRVQQSRVSLRHDI